MLATQERIRIEGWPASEILAHFEARHPKIADALARAREAVPQTKREVWPFQAAALYALAHQYTHTGAELLEIGTALGYSAAVIAQACYPGHLTTLNPKPLETVQACENLRPFANVTFLPIYSHAYLAQYTCPTLDMVFVDGDHTAEGVRRDMPWFSQLKTGGLLLFHDYSPAGSKRPTPDVFEAVNELRDRLGRDFDVLVVDDGHVGMAGWYRRQGEVLTDG